MMEGNNDRSDCGSDGRQSGRGTGNRPRSRRGRRGQRGLVARTVWLPARAQGEARGGASLDGHARTPLAAARGARRADLFPGGCNSIWHFSFRKEFLIFTAIKFSSK